MANLKYKLTRIIRKLRIDVLYYYMFHTKELNTNFRELDSFGVIDLSHLVSRSEMTNLFDKIEDTGSKFGTKNDLWNTFSCPLNECPDWFTEVILDTSKKLSAMDGGNFSVDYILLTVNEKVFEKHLYSQNFHYDYDASRVYKMFIFVDRISKKDGPFLFYNKDESRRFRFVNLSSYGVSDKLISRHQRSEPNMILNADNELRAMLVNTRDCLHAGGRLKIGGKRRMLTVTFVSDY